MNTIDSKIFETTSDLNKLPVYKALITDEDEGIFVISLVDMPATEVNWMCFNKNEKRQTFKITNAEQHILSGVVMTADTPIYRVSPEGQEYYIMFTKDVIQKMAEKMLSDNTFNNIDIQHNGELLPEGQVKLVELFICDKNKGINPNYIDVPNGSLMANYKVYDENLWNEIKNGDLNGFSLEGYFTPDLITGKSQTELKKHNIYNEKMKKFKETLRKLLISLGEIKTDKGFLEYEDELVEGADVKIDNEIAPDAEYVSDELIIVVKDGKVVEIKEKTVEDKPADETTEEVIEETKEEVIEKDPEINPVEQDINELTKKIEEHDIILKELGKSVEELNKLVKELSNTPVIEPIEEVFTKKVNKKTNKAIEIASYLNK